MAVKDKNVQPSAVIASDKDATEIVTALSLTSAVVYAYTPGYDYQLVRVRSYCRTKAGTATFVVKVGTRTAVATGVFTAATEVGATLSTTLANVQGSSTEATTIELTTDGSGVLTNAKVYLEWRPRHMNGEI